MCYSTGRALQYSCFLDTFCSRPADDGIPCGLELSLCDGSDETVDIGLSNLNTNELFVGSMFDLRWCNSAEVKTIDDISTASAAG